MDNSKEIELRMLLKLAEDDEVIDLGEFRKSKGPTETIIPNGNAPTTDINEFRDRSNPQDLKVNTKDVTLNTLPPEEILKLREYLMIEEFEATPESLMEFIEHLLDYGVEGEIISSRRFTKNRLIEYAEEFEVIYTDYNGGTYFVFYDNNVE